MKRLDKVAKVKLLVFPACLLPFGLLANKAVHNGLGANPVSVITLSTGFWTLTFLMITLGITPLRRVTGWIGLIRFRRMTGLFAFFYGFLHLMTFVWLDQYFDVRSMIHEVYKRPYITAGATAFLLMAPLALTSTRGWIRRLGGRRWNRLHKLVYASATAGVVHFWWLVKKDLTQPEIFAAILAVLLGARVLWWVAKRRAAHRPLAEVAAD
jgi:sulfoxide reductase heme-binding subunit YedZ